LFSLFAKKYTISGYVKDKSNGEMLIGANVYIKGTQTGTISNLYGYYSLTLEEGDYQIIYNFIGYQLAEVKIQLDENHIQNMDLEPTLEQIDEVIIKAERENKNIISTQMSTVSLSAKTIKQIPVLMGETDIIKTMQLLPGIKTTGGLSSGMSVRGGARDHNLIMLDEATVYNAAHLGGIFSIFNNDAIKNVEIYM
ncbi:carboxypeptidase-like regulatory domain-containing protein, partial [Bacteroidota bacterium]